MVKTLPTRRVDQRPSGKPRKVPFTPLPLCTIVSVEFATTAVLAADLKWNLIEIDRSAGIKLSVGAGGDAVAGSGSIDRHGQWTARRQTERASEHTQQRD